MTDLSVGGPTPGSLPWLCTDVVVVTGSSHSKSMHDQQELHIPNIHRLYFRTGSFVILKWLTSSNQLILLEQCRFPNISEARTGIQELLAARAVGAIAENVKHISLKELLKSLEAELAEVGFSDASRDVGVSFSNICPNTTTGLSFKSFDINKVLEFGSPLLASDGQVMVLYLSRNLLKPKCYLASTLLYL
ncbi:uncharacterized protein LOC121979870 [Zingiber officinale]|uniref:uncharacterized protein LOC121979870 n=1 Tax=Zingiber officinale TaxID=94328 RepID=UPI001C4B75AA|nr:uncharacterized protein LOC121979870 [Zingiber officinale]